MAKSKLMATPNPTNIHPALGAHFIARDPCEYAGRDFEVTVWPSLGDAQPWGCCQGGKETIPTYVLAESCLVQEGQHARVAGEKQASGKASG